MKKKCMLVSLVLISLFHHKTIAQQNNYAVIPSEHLEITFNKTTNLIFPYAVQNIDRGSKDILVQQPKGTENIVQLKADKPNFTQTNLSVITSDGKLYSFIVDYIAHPNQLNIIVQNGNVQSNDSSYKQPVLLTAVNEALFQAVTARIMKKKAKHGERDRNNQMEFRLNGIYINHDVLYFRFQLQNYSNISYDIDNIKFTTKDRQRSKRTATQETEVTPVYKSGNFDKVQADSIAIGIIALPKFTLSDSKYLSIQILEKNGGRHLHLILYNRQLMKAIPINEF